MRFLENPSLARISTQLRDLDVGDRILNGRLELFSTSLPGLDDASSALRNAQTRAEATLLTPRRTSSSENGAAERRNGAHTSPPPPQPQKRRLSSTSTKSSCISDRATSVPAKNTRNRRNSVLLSPSDPPPLTYLQKRRRSRTISDVVMQLRHSELCTNDGFERTFESGERSPTTEDEVAREVEKLGVSSAAEARRLLLSLVTSMNALFTDYDFSDLSPESFVHERDFIKVYATINHNLCFFVDPVFPGFAQTLWGAIRNCVDLRTAKIYSYDAARNSGADPFTDDSECLSAFDFFFVDADRVLFVACVTRKKPPLLWSDEEISENSQKSLSSDTDTDISDLDGLLETPVEPLFADEVGS